MKVIEATSPTNLIFENFDYKFRYRLPRVMLALAVIILLFGVVFGLSLYMQKGQKQLQSKYQHNIGCNNIFKHYHQS